MQLQAIVSHTLKRWLDGDTAGVKTKSALNGCVGNQLLFEVG